MPIVRLNSDRILRSCSFLSGVDRKKNVLTTLGCSLSMILQAMSVECDERELQKYPGNCFCDRAYSQVESILIGVVIENGFIDEDYFDLKFKCFEVLNTVCISPIFKFILFDSISP